MAARTPLALAVITIAFIAAAPRHQASASTTAGSSNNGEGTSQQSLHRVERETLRIYPPRVGRMEHVLASPHVHKRAANLAMFPRVGRASNLQPFPRLGRAPTLAAFPRVGRADPGMIASEMSAWCPKCPEISFLRQLARRAVMPPRIGRSGEKTSYSYMVARPRIGKRLRSPGSAMEAKRQIQGLAAFPRVGRSGDQIEDEEDPKWFAEPIKRESSDSNLWFGPRLGRKKRDLQDQMTADDSLYPVYHLMEAPLYDTEDHEGQGSSSHESSSSNSWSSAAFQ